MIIGYSFSSPSARAANADYLTENGAERVYSDVEESRPRLQAMLDFLRDGDVVLVRSGSQLGGCLDEILNFAKRLKDAGADLRVAGYESEIPVLAALDAVASLLAGTPGAKASVPEATVALREHVAPRASVLRHPSKGRRLSATEHEQIRAMLRAGRRQTEVCAAFGVSTATVWRIAKEVRAH